MRLGDRGHDAGELRCQGREERPDSHLGEPQVRETGRMHPPALALGTGSAHCSLFAERFPALHLLPFGQGQVRGNALEQRRHPLLTTGTRMHAGHGGSMPSLLRTVGTCSAWGAFRQDIP